jgi:predicted MPP superfamily phosphohydrolase
VVQGTRIKPRQDSRLPQKISRRTFLKATAGVGAGAALGCLGAALRQPYDIRVEHLGIRLARLPQSFDGLRLVQLSDIHFDEYMSKSHLQHIVDLTNAQSPDLILLTGDYVTASPFDAGNSSDNDRRAEKAWPCSEVLHGLVNARYGRIAILGNHDCFTNPEIVTEALTSGRFLVLRNRSLPVESHGARFWLAGVDDILEHYGDPEATMSGVPGNECVVVAMHEPDYVEEVLDYGIDFQISGHSHGGQVCLPGIGPLYLPKGARKYPLGYYRLGDVQLYTNRGVGVIHLPVRFMCPPEITVFTLLSGR